MTECTLALAQIESSCLDQRGNLEKMIAYARRAEEAGADLLCFPEGALTGYCTERAREFALPLDSTPCLRLAALARELGLLIAVGLLERAPDGRVFITQMLCRPDGIHRFYRKTHLGGKEAGWISAGDRLPVFETAQGVIGMAVCYDTHYPALVETLSLKGAELVLAPFASPKDSLRRETWMKYLPPGHMTTGFISAAVIWWAAMESADIFRAAPSSLTRTARLSARIFHRRKRC